MKTYKGFNMDMTCRDFQYEEGKEYETDHAECCETGFHACEDPIDCFGYYAPATSVYHEVEQGGVISRNGDDSKVASSKIKIGARLDIAKIVALHFDYVKSRTTTEHTDPKIASAGYCGAASAGENGAASAGESGAATSRGSAEVGKNGIACARGNGCKVKGGLGAILVIAEEKKDGYDIENWKAFIIDGEKYKPDTWYTIKNNDIIEVEE